MKTLVAIPCLDMMHTDFVRSILSMDTEGEVQFTFAQSSLVYESRNTLAQIALDGGFDRVLWLDSDMSFPPDLFKKLSADLDEGKELVCGLCVTRKVPVKPTIYKRLYFSYETGRPIAKADNFTDWPDDRLFEVEGCGLAVAMVTTDLLRRVKNLFGAPFQPEGGFGEDLSFCRRSRKLGAKLWCDPRITIGHVGLATYTTELLERGKEGE